MNQILSRAAIWTGSVAMMLSGCASGPAPQPTPALPYHRVAVIRVASPEHVYTQNRQFPLPIVPLLIAGSVSNRVKTREFDAHMREPLKALGPELTVMLIDELAARGIQAQIFDDFPRDPPNSDDIDYPSLQTEDAVLHVWFSDISMDSPATAAYYLPRINIRAAFLPRPDASHEHIQYLYYYYGKDAEGAGAAGIPSHEKYRFPNFDSLIAQSAEVRESWHAGLRAVARRVAQDIDHRDRQVDFQTREKAQ